MAETFNVTSAGIDPATDRTGRTRFYLISMGIRVLCVLCLLFTPGWWAVLPILGAVVLPYFAVIVANNIAPVRDGAGVSPVTPLELSQPETPQHRTAPTLVVDAFGERQATGERLPDTDWSGQ